MKIITILLSILLITTSVYAKEKKSYTQWDTFRFSIDNKNAMKFTKNMRAHIKKYHTKGPRKTTIYNVMYGPNINDLLWVMGPVSYSELDSLGGNTAHDEDWAKNINPYIVEYKQGEIWRQMDDMVINNLKKNDKQPGKFMSRYLTVNPDVNNETVLYLLSQVKKTLNKIGKVKYWGVMDNQFIQGHLNGRHLMELSSFYKWAEMDEEWEFSKHFEEIYGKNSFKAFIDAYNHAFTNQWHEIITVNKKMSNL